MDRKERRRQEKLQKSNDKKLAKMETKKSNEFDRNSRWISSLSGWQNDCIKQTIATAVKLATKEGRIDGELDAIAVVDKILTGVLFERTDMSWEESFEFNKEFGKYYAEYRFVESKFGKENRLKMLMKLENEIINKVEKWIAEGMTRGQIVKELVSGYKEVAGITTPEANNVYKRTHEKYKLYVKELEVEIIKRSIDLLKMNKVSNEIISILKIEYQKIAEQDLRGIFIIAKDEFMKPQYEDYSNVPYVGSESDNKADEKKKKKKEGKKEKVVNKAIEEKKENIDVVDVKFKEVKEEMSRLKIVKEVVKVVSRELEGEFGKYVADENGVTREDKVFENLDAVETYKKEQLEKFEREIAELEAVFAFREQ